MHSDYPNWPAFSQDEIDAVGRVLQTGRVNYWTGDQGKLFEKEFAEFIGTNHAVTVANGTVALELALYALDIGPGDEVIVPSRTFIATASCVAVRSAKPVVVDIDPVSQNMTADTIKPHLSPKTKAIIVVHLAGWPCDMAPILQLAAQHGCKVIEDCAQAHGAQYQGKCVGSWGDIATFSFCQDKIMTTGGDGGMVTTDDPHLWERAWSYKDHGKSFEKMQQTPTSSSFRWVHDTFGSNLRMTEMQAAIGRLQLQKLLDWLSIRRRNAALFNSMLGDVPGLQIYQPPADVYHAYYKYYVFIKPEQLKSGWDRDKILQLLKCEGVPCFSGSCPEIYREQAFISRNWCPEQPFPVARELGETSLMFLVHPGLELEHIEKMCRIIRGIMTDAT